MPRSWGPALNTSTARTWKWKSSRNWPISSMSSCAPTRPRWPRHPRRRRPRAARPPGSESRARGRGRCQPLRKEHFAVRLDQDGLDVAELLVDPDRRLGAQHEGGLGQTVRACRGRGNHGGAAHRARGVPGARIDDVVVAHAVLVEVVLVVTGGRDRRIDQRQPRDHLILAIRVANPDDPGFAKAVAHYAAVAACRDQGVPDAAALQNLNAAIDGLTLGDGPELDAH